ncbi:hypothetical protein, partial [Lacticaseibacillus paracasei]
KLPINSKYRSALINESGFFCKHVQKRLQACKCPMVVRVLVHDLEHEEPALRTLRFARKVFAVHLIKNPL